MPMILCIQGPYSCTCFAVGNGHACLFLQLQFSALMSCGWLFLITRVLWLVIIGFNLTHATVTDLNCVPLTILCNLLPIGKCVSTSLSKLGAMFVLTFLLNGRLNK